jgi:UDP-glucose 4-epimerase
VTENVVVTGASGFIGAAVVRELIARGLSVTALVRSSSNTRRLTGTGVSTIVHDLESSQSINPTLESRKPSILIHCAWRGVAGQERNERFQTTENVDMTIASVELAVSLGCSQWIGLGSQAEYGNQNVRLDENAPLLPTTRYGEAKKEAGRRALSKCDEKGIAGVWMRIFSTYGPDDSPGWFIPYVIRELIADRSPRLTLCEQVWDFLYVDDAARAIAAVADGARRGVFNLGSGTARPLRTYVDAARKEVGTTAVPIYGAIPYRPDQVMHLEADISRLVTVTGWKPRVSVAEGMKNTVAFERQRST